MVSRACSCQHRRLNDTAFLPVLGISRQDEIFAYSTCFFSLLSLKVFWYVYTG